MLFSILLCFLFPLKKKNQYVQKKILVNKSKNKYLKD